MGGEGFFGFFVLLFWFYLLAWLVGFGLVFFLNYPHLIFLKSLTDFYFIFPHCFPVVSLLKLDNTETQMELQDVDPGTGDKNENVKDKNQQNYQGRAFLWYRI